MDFLDPTVLGPLFRFNREFYRLDDRGRPSGYQNLASLNARIKSYMLRRRKADVETELPDRTDKTFFVPLSDGQKKAYTDHEAEVMRLAAQARRRPLTQSEQDKLQRELAMMRMICDTNYILDPDDRVCPKLGELEKILEECRDNADVKVIIFSEWERMLLLVRGLCQKHGLSEAERAKATAHRGQAERRLKMSRVLDAADLAAEGRQALLEAVQALGSALVVEHRLAEPETTADVMAPSLAWCWGEGLPLVKTFLAEDSVECEPLALAIERLLTASVSAA